MNCAHFFSRQYSRLTPKIDVGVYVRSGDMITLATSGMSNWRLHGLPDEEDIPKRVELIFYLVANKPDTL